LAQRTRMPKRTQREGLASWSEGGTVHSKKAIECALRHPIWARRPRSNNCSAQWSNSISPNEHCHPRACHRNQIMRGRGIQLWQPTWISRREEWRGTYGSRLDVALLPIDPCKGHAGLIRRQRASSVWRE